MQRLKSSLIIIALVIFSNTITHAQEADKKTDVHQFTMLHQVKTTPVKDQNRTGTCWSFAATSFMETELIRMGKGEFDLAEMFNVRATYPGRAETYIRYHGAFNFGNGGQAHDAMNVVRKFGIVPEKVFPGKKFDVTGHNHGEMDAVLKAVVNTIVKNPGKAISPFWQDVVEATLDIYLGDMPETFDYEGEEYTPKSFAAELGIIPDDYIELTSYTHHPFYSLIDLEIPDNFAHGLYFNIPVDDLVATINNALENGYSVVWDGDVGRKHFLRDEGYAVIPADEKNEEETTGPETEKVITQEMRQEAFDSYDTTDDHLIHITGLAENQNGTKFYYTKNSWGVDDFKYGGYWYMSEPYVRLRTVAIMIHKDAVPENLKDKLGL